MDLYAEITESEKTLSDFLKEKARTEHLLHLEDTALEGSTIVLCLLIMAIGLTSRFLGEVTGQTPALLFQVLALVVGFVGVVAAVLLNRWYASSSKKLDANR